LVFIFSHALSQDNMENPQYIVLPENEERIKELYAQKTALLDKYGLFGGGWEVNAEHHLINQELEKLGVDPNS
jgi:hypothetical protein